MNPHFSLRDVPLPRDWSEKVKTAILHTISLAHLAITYTRSLAANSVNARVRHAAELDRASEEVSLLRDELRLKDARMGRLAPHRRPYYRATERMGILELKAVRGWSQAETARRFLLKPTTIASWGKRIDEGGPRALVQVREPVNKFPSLVRHIVGRLKVLCPTMGKKRIAETLAWAGLHLGVSTVGRMLKEKEPEPRDPAGEGSVEEDTRLDSAMGIVSRRPNHTWLVDLTTFPISGGFWTPWRPFSLPQVWPFCWWVVCAVDHYSRHVMALAVFKKPPKSVEVRAFLGRTMGKMEVRPKYLICDKGKQFWNPAFMAWCRRKRIDPRYGAVGKHGSIALIERFIRSLKEEWLRRIIVPFRVERMRRDLSVYAAWFNQHRPHQGLGGVTPLAVYEGRNSLHGKSRKGADGFRDQFPCSASRSKVGEPPRDRLELSVSHFEGRRQLPVVSLKRVA